jgi:hypothetical protein
VLQKGFSALILLPTIVTIVVIGALGWMLINKPQSVKTVSSPKPVVSTSPSLTPLPSVAQNSYKNSQLGFEFDLKPGERVASCSGESEVSDAYVFQITTSPKPESPGLEPLCQPSDATPLNAIGVSKVGAPYFPASVQDYINELERDYHLNRTTVDISGVNAVRVKGDVMHLAPLPDSVDKVVFDHQGYFFDVDAIYLDRNFRFANP